MPNWINSFWMKLISCDKKFFIVQHCRPGGLDPKCAKFIQLKLYFNYSLHCTSPSVQMIIKFSQHPCATCLQDSFNICLFFSLRKMRKKERCHMSANATGRASVFSTFSSSAVCQNLMADAPPHFWPKVRFYWVIFLFKDSFKHQLVGIQISPIILLSPLLGGSLTLTAFCCRHL